MSALQAADPSPRHGQPAGLVSRGAAAVVDFGVVWVVGTGITLTITLIRTVLNDDTAGLDLPGLFAVFAGAILLEMYLWVCWSLGGRTLGQLLLGLRVQRVGGGHVGVIRGFGRAWMATYLLVLLFVSAVSRRSGAGWDLVLDTEVVYDWSKATPKPR